MSLDYKPLNVLIATFQVNICGADLLGALHGACGARLSKPDWMCPRVPYRATADEAFTMAEILAKAGEDTWVKVLDNNQFADGWGGTQQEWLAFCASWIIFLACCGGYEAF